MYESGTNRSKGLRGVDVLSALVVQALAADESLDQRGDVSINAHAGYVIDNFASDGTKTYLNYNDANSNKTRAIFGFDMEYRLLGYGGWTRNELLAKGPNPEEHPFFNGIFNPQLWVYGHTLHGMRSAEVDCNAHPTLAVCSNQVLAAPNANNNLYLLRNATSLEAHLGMRYEFMTLQAAGTSPANVYLNGTLGFLSVTHHGGDVIDMHSAGLGAVIIDGPFMNSFLETGYGKTDLFSRHRNRRFKVSAKAVWSPAQSSIQALKGVSLLDGISLFVQMVADTDMGAGADNIQTYLGVFYSLDRAL